MTTTTDIGNRALQLLGTRSNMSSLVETSNEALQISLAIGPIQNWCFGLANWNFARTTAALTIAKGPPTVSPGAWSTTNPSPPWLYEYPLPADYIRAQYITNNSVAAPIAGWSGEPKRFAIGIDTISAVQQQVLLTNESAVNLIYTASIADPTLWPWYFERLTVIALAHTVCIALTGDKKLWEELTQMLEQQINIAAQSNTAEGLITSDTTPEWIQAIGIDYPYRRLQNQMQPATQRRPRQPITVGGGNDDNNG